MSRHKKYDYTSMILFLLHFYLLTYYLIFHFFWIWPPLAGGYLHHNILTCIKNILTTVTASPNNKTAPYSHPLTLYYSLILWEVILLLFSEINVFFFWMLSFSRKMAIIWVTKAIHIYLYALQTIYVQASLLNSTTVIPTFSFPC